MKINATVLLKNYYRKKINDFNEKLEMSILQVEKFSRGRQLLLIKL